MEGRFASLLVYLLNKSINEYGGKKNAKKLIEHARLFWSSEHSVCLVEKIITYSGWIVTFSISISW